VGTHPSDAANRLAAPHAGNTDMMKLLIRLEVGLYRAAAIAKAVATIWSLFQ
jgi:hypothetical protein